MKKVLIIAYAIPSRGSFRPLPLAKYLPEFGWQPIVLAGPIGIAQNSPFKIIETPYREPFLAHLYRRLSRSYGSAEGQPKGRYGIVAKTNLLDSLSVLARAIFYYPDASRGWKPFALEAGKTLIEQESIAAIISHSPPVTGHIVASELKARYRIPWIADFPDLWSRNHYYPYGPIRKWFDTRLELKTLSRADALVTVSQPWADKLKTLHKGKTVHVIHHGFDPAEINDPPAELTDNFTITYTGLVYTGRQQPSKLFQALRDLISNGTMDPDDIEVRFFGRSHKEFWLEREIEQYGLSSIVKQHGAVPREIALQKQRESQVLLLLNYDYPGEGGGYSYKIFEYLGARRPILAVGGSKGDVVERLLDETDAGIHAPTTEDIKSALKKLYQEYKLKDKVSHKAKESEVSKYNYLDMARKFSDILDYLDLK